MWSSGQRTRLILSWSKFEYYWQLLYSFLLYYCTNMKKKRHFLIGIFRAFFLKRPSLSPIPLWRIIANYCLTIKKILPGSVTRLGHFRKFLEANFLVKVAQIFGNFLGYFEVCHCIIKSYFGFFLRKCWKIWVNVYSITKSHWSQVSFNKT